MLFSWQDVVKINHYVGDAMKVIWVKQTRRTLGSEEVDLLKCLGRLRVRPGEGKECSNLDKMKYKRTFQMEKYYRPSVNWDSDS